MKLKYAIVAGLSVLFVAVVAPAQLNVRRNCAGRIFKPSEVSKPARIKQYPNFDIARLPPGTRGRFVIEAVLCRNGMVTDIRVIQGTSPETNELMRAAVYTSVKFEPAEYNWHTVSQWTKFEIQVGPDGPGITVSTSTETAERLVEEVNIVGQRRLTTKQILSWIQTKPGDRYREAQIKRDFNALLASGRFDKTQTRVTIGEAVRGGVAVTFQVVELPVIGEIDFEGLKIDRLAMMEALKKANVNLEPESVYSEQAVSSAVQVIRLHLASTGQGNFNVEPRFEHINSMKVNITFVITPKQ